MEAEAPLEREAVALEDTVLLALRVEEGVACAVPEPEPVALLVGLTEDVGVAERDADREVLPVLLLLAPMDREAAALTDTVLLVVALELGVPVPLLLLLVDCVCVPVPDPELLAVPDALAPGLREAVGELLKEALRLRVLEGVEAPVPLPLCVGVPEGEAVPEEEAELLSVPLLLPLLDALAPGDSGGVPLALTVLLPLWVVEGVPLAVGLLLPVPLTVEEGEDVSGGVALPLRELLPEFEAEAPAVSEALGDPEAVEEPERVEEGVGCAVEVPELEELLVGVPELVGLADGVSDAVGVTEREDDQELLAEFEAEAPAVMEAVALALTVLEELRVLEGVTEAVPVPVLLELEVGVGEELTGGVPLLLNELLPVLEAEAPAVRDAEGEVDTVEEPERVEDGVG